MSVEVLTILSIAFLVFILLLGIYNDRRREIAFEKEIIDAKKIVNNFAYNINSVYLATNSTTKTIYVSDNINDKNYTLSVRQNLLELTWSGGYYSYPLLTSNVDANFSNYGEFRIQNNDGLIVISPVST
jgi:hypothetical protein